MDVFQMVMNGRVQMKDLPSYTHPASELPLIFNTMRTTHGDLIGPNVLLSVR